MPDLIKRADTQLNVRCAYCRRETSEANSQTIACKDGAHDKCLGRTACGYSETARFEHPCGCPCHG